MKDKRILALFDAYLIASLKVEPTLSASRRRDKVVYVMSHTMSPQPLRARRVLRVLARAGHCQLRLMRKRAPRDEQWAEPIFNIAIWPEPS